MKKIQLFLALGAFIFSGLAIYFAKSSSELVYVDVSKLIEGYTRTKSAKVEFEKKVTSLKANVDSLMNGWQMELKDYEKNKSIYSATELKLKQEVLANKQQKINGFQQSIQKKIQEEDAKITQTVVNDINDFIKEYGKKHGYKIIFGASGTGNIMFADESTDLTDEVLAGLNAEYNGKK